MQCAVNHEDSVANGTLSAVKHREESRKIVSEFDSV